MLSATHHLLPARRGDQNLRLFWPQATELKVRAIPNPGLAPRILRQRTNGEWIVHAHS